MDPDTVNIESYKGRIHDKAAAERLFDLTDIEISTLKPIVAQIALSKSSAKIKLFKQSDETLRAIQADLLVRRMRFVSELSGLDTKIRKIDRVLHLRKKEIKDD